jgi:hypothetical protein
MTQLSLIPPPTRLTTQARGKARVLAVHERSTWSPYRDASSGWGSSVVNVEHLDRRPLALLSSGHRLAPPGSGFVPLPLRRLHPVECDASHGAVGGVERWASGSIGEQARHTGSDSL